MARRILIVTSGHLCRHPRPLKEARALTAAGHAVTVLGVRNHAPSEARDAALLAADPFRRINVDLLHGPAARLRRMLGRLARTASARFRLHSVAAFGATGALTRLARREAADLTIVHTEAGFAVGAALLRDGLRVAADFEDWHSEDLLPEVRKQRPLRLLRDLERTLLRNSVHTTTTSDALAGALQEAYGGQRPEVVANAFPLQPAPAPRPRDRVPQLVWFSQTVGPGRGLEEFLSAWARTPLAGDVTLIGDIDPGYAQVLRSLLPTAKQGRLLLRAPVAVADLPALLATFDAGLALESTSPPSRNLTITNKILQYLNAGLAVIATPTLGQQEVLAAGPEAGWLLPPDASAWSPLLAGWLGDRAGLARRQAAARTLAEREYCWEVASSRLTRIVAASLERAP